MEELEKAIKRLEALRDESYFKANQGRHPNYSANKQGQYTAYHKAIEIIKAALRKETDVPGCVACGAVIPEGRQVCPKCEGGAGYGK